MLNQAYQLGVALALKEAAQVEADPSENEAPPILTLKSMVKDLEDPHDYTNGPSATASKTPGDVTTGVSWDARQELSTGSEF
jgi:hypothetical protein